MGAADKISRSRRPPLIAPPPKLVAARLVKRLPVAATSQLANASDARGDKLAAHLSSGDQLN